MIRRLSVIGIALSLMSATAGAADRASGILTMGCGDVSLSLEVDDAEPLAGSPLIAVEATAAQREQLFDLAGLKPIQRRTWTSLHVELDGRFDAEVTDGYFGKYARKFTVSDVRASRLLAPRESMNAYRDELQTYHGYMFVDREMVAFLPLEHKGEAWWIFADNDGVNAEVKKRFGEFDFDNARGFKRQFARVEIEGWIGPPGRYGHLSAFIREIVVSHLKYEAQATTDELKEAGVVGGPEPPLLRCAPLW
jgi:hypothetical protein